MTATTNVCYVQDMNADSAGGVNPRVLVQRVDTNSTDASAIALNTETTILVNGGTTQTRTLAPGVEGQDKVLWCKTSGTSIAVTLTGNNAARDVLTFDAAGEAVVLKYLDGEWRVIVNIGAVGVA